MVATFSFDIDPETDFVRITMGGFFETEDLDRFVAVQNEAYKALRCRSNSHVTLVDIRDMRIQSQDSVAAFRERLSERRVAARRIAFVVSKSLATRQIARAIEGLDAQLFVDVEDAVAWLFETS